MALYLPISGNTHFMPFVTLGIEYIKSRFPAHSTMIELALQPQTSIPQGGERMAQYRNVLSWFETEYLNPAMDITKKVINKSDTEDLGNYSELKDLEELLEKALEYVRRHQN